MKWSSGAKYFGAILFVIGVVMLVLSIGGLMPDGSGKAYTNTMFTQLIINIGMLLVSTFMVSTGMFFLVYGGQKTTTEWYDKE
jgi:hypothetical protein